MKIAVVGTRGFPQIQGGVEAHCENLYPYLVKKGCEVVVFTRKPYVTYPQDAFKGVSLITLSCPKSKFLEAFMHTFKGVFAARKIHPDILHIHAIGPALFVPLARLLGFKVVMTHHGPDYERKKWGAAAKIVLKLGEYLGCRFANQIIAISEPIAQTLSSKYGIKVNIVPNGVVISGVPELSGLLGKFGLEKGKYILAVGRFVPEKGFDDLIEAFDRSNIRGWKLVIVGGADHEDKYSKTLEEKAGRNKNIVLTGHLTAEPLRELYAYAGIFALPSYYEGLPIVLLEAMSYGLPCIVSDIPANRIVGLTENNFFKVGNIQELTEKIRYFIDKPLTEEEKVAQIKMIFESYNWDNIADKTLEVYKKIL